jgi:hypothetical protein
MPSRDRAISERDMARGASKPPSIVVAVLGARAEPYPPMIRAIRETWASVAVPRVETLVYFGGDALHEDGDEVVLPVPDDLANAGRKTLAFFEYLLAERPFDVLFRTNCSSYVDLRNLRDYADRLDSPRSFYGGILGYRGDVPFASGSGYFIGRDVVEVALARRDEWEHKLADDQALAFVLAAGGVEPKATRRQDLLRVRDARHVDTTQFHVRCRTDSWRRRRDPKIMRAVHRAFLKARAA